MRKLVLSVFMAMVALVAMSPTAAAQGPGAGRTIQHQGSSIQIRFEGLVFGGADVTGDRWIKTGEEAWQKDGTWKKNGWDVESYDGTTLMFTNTNAANFTKFWGSVTDHQDPNGNTNWYEI